MTKKERIDVYLIDNATVLEDLDELVGDKDNTFQTGNKDGETFTIPTTSILFIKFTSQ